MLEGSWDAERLNERAIQRGVSAGGLLWCRRFSMAPQVSYSLAEGLGPTRRRGTRQPAALRSYRPRVEQLEDRTLMAGVAWGGHARDPQHTATSPVASQPLEEIAWQTPVDLAPQYTPGSNYLLIHYG